jgi:hypothetical protein
VQELVGNTDHNKGSVLDDILEVGDGNEVSGKFDVGKVSRVFVSSVDDVCQFLALNLAVSFSERILHGGRPLTCFCLTHILTSEWNSLLFFATFSAAIFANAVPHDPDPITATLCLPVGRGERGRDC